ncbi:histidine triad nucleotide-binding protein [Gorillibacterium timonense]|uniref:histidine triad nucleotide-binding protein n=1 Tax=Gorillibacterium timonense TaxID=1689269 RepID=UPI00071DD115|nr:histidine triad nucleotide-binding protein [Gorillibacterium timonense]
MLKECIFCQIIAGDTPCRKVYEDDEVLVFHDIQPAAPVHALIIPKTHIASMNDVGREQEGIIAAIHRAAQITAIELGIAETGYRLVNNCGPDAGQVVHHLHYHLLGGKKLGMTQ